MKVDRPKPKSSKSRARTYEEMGEYWDVHDLPPSRASGKPPEFSVDIRRRRFLVAIEPGLFAKVRRRATRKGLTTESLLNLWILEKCARTR
jgi:hypothetical protein